ncbi:MAG: recombinase family protein [Clostridia bacterium]|nr:recombinase family protein [Clostridia bacterium]
MRGVIYARYSSDNQREESIEGQIRECKAFAERNGIDIIGSYIDRAFSAKTDNRPDFQHMMAGESGKRRDISVYRYYKCSGVKRRLGCDKKTVRKDWIENLVVEEIKSIVHNDEAIEYIANRVMEIQGKTHTILPYLREQLAEVEKGIENLVNAIQMGIFNEATKKRMDALETRKTELNIQIAKEELAKPTLTKDQIVCWLEHFRTFDVSKLEHRRRFIDTFINRIFLYDDKMVITFNYNKGTKTITFAELEASGILSNFSPTGEPSLEVNLTTPAESPCFTRAFCVFRGKKHTSFTIAPFLEPYGLESATR